MDQIITRHRHDLKRRTLTVAEAFYLTPHMIRIMLTGEDLADFISLSPDDHIKLIFPTDTEKPEMRDYTPRSFDCKAQTLTIDFAIHDAGPATAWAIQAAPGDTLQIAGPRGSAVVAQIFDWWLLIGDETALPAIGRRVEELPEGVDVITLTAVPGLEDRQEFVSKARHESRWLYRPVSEAADPAALVDAAKSVILPEGKGFIWIAAEAKVARALKDHFLDERAHPHTWMKASGYWVQGQADTADKTLE